MSKEKEENKSYICHVCEELVREKDAVISAYGDHYCSSCDNLKQKFPRKTLDELKTLAPYHGEEREVSFEVNFYLNLSIFAVIALLLYLFIR